MSSVGTIPQAERLPERTRRSRKSAPALASLPASLLTASKVSSRRSIWCGLGIIFLFAVSYLQLGLVSLNHAPAAKRVNNGKQPTFFAFCIEPYGLASEDFHLYWMRSKRILDRGWSDSLLNETTKK